MIRGSRWGGLFAGTVVGLTGLGGAAIVTPMLLLLFNVPAPIAVSTDLVSAAVMKPVGAAVHIKRRTPYWAVVLWLSCGSVPGVLFGSWLFSLIAESSSGEETLRKIIGTVLVAAVAITLFRLRLRKYAEQHAEQSLVFSRGRLLVAGVVGLTVGTLVGLTSVGSGTLIAAALLILFPAMLPSRLVGTDIVQAVPMLIVGAIAHAGLGEIDWAIVVSLLCWGRSRVSSSEPGCPVLTTARNCGICCRCWWAPGESRCWAPRRGSVPASPSSAFSGWGC